MLFTDLIRYRRALPKLWRDKHISIHTALRNELPYLISRPVLNLEYFKCPSPRHLLPSRYSCVLSSHKILNVSCATRNAYSYYKFCCITLKQNYMLRVRKIWHAIPPCLFQRYNNDEHVPATHSTFFRIYNVPIPYKQRPGHVPFKMNVRTMCLSVHRTAAGAPLCPVAISASPCISISGTDST